MAKSRILKLVLWVMSALPIAISRWMEGLSIGTFRSDLERCLVFVDQHKKSVPPVFIDALVVAEDHRSMYHWGVDPIGILRALWIQVISGHIQGASTIEQQFVRVVTGRYERTILRKAREQLLAIALVRHRAKESIASAYLAVAFYGSGCIGLEGLNAEFGPYLEYVGEHKALMFVCQLKYPRPLNPNGLWINKINTRTEALLNRRVRVTNKSLQSRFDSLLKRR